MSANVTDLLTERRKRGRDPLHFPTPIEALQFASEQVRELRAKADSALLLEGQELDLPLSQLAGVLDACLRLYTRPRREENA